jgi:DNA polymerase-3 subunit delta
VSASLAASLNAWSGGSTTEAERTLWCAGSTPGTIIGTALRQVAQLHKARLAVDAGASIDEAVGATYVHFSRRDAVKAALGTWTSPRLERAMAQLAEAALETRRQSVLGEMITQRALLALAVNARRKQQGEERR